jgi:hypothetical protein
VRTAARLGSGRGAGEGVPFGVDLVLLLDAASEEAEVQGVRAFLLGPAGNERIPKRN